MSLHTLANHIQEAGRGDDKILVHMTPREVGGLEAIARAHGGTLTTNPQTGLPEAGFLDAILPTVAGLGLSMIPGVGPLLAAGIVGGVTGLAKGSLTEGLMAGLGAYGGAGIGQSLASAGASNAAAQASQGLTTNIASVPLNTSSYSGLNVAKDAATSGLTSGATSGASNLLAANSGSTLQNAIMSGGTPLTQGAGQLAQGSGQLAQGGGDLIRSTAGQTLTGAQQFPAAQSWGEWTNSAAGKLAGNQAAPTFGSNMSAVGEGAKNTFSSFGNAKDFAMNNKMNLAMAAAPGIYSAMNPEPVNFSGIGGSGSKGTVRPYRYDSTLNEEAFAPTTSSAERQFYASEPRFTPAAEGGLMSYAVGGPVEQMSAQNAVGSNTMYPQSQLQTAMYANPTMQRPMPNDVISAGIDVPTDRYTGEPTMGMGIAANYPMMEKQLAMKNAQIMERGYADGGIASGGYNLGGYSDGGRLLKGPGDGVSDSIPAVIGKRQPARLADGEFVIPARIVSELGNGSTEAGARKLYAMMDRIQKNRKKSVGKNKVAVDSKSHKYLPA